MDGHTRHNFKHTLETREGTGKWKDSKFLVEIILIPARQIAAKGAGNDPPLQL